VAKPETEEVDPKREKRVFRCGVMARKMGMMGLFDKTGERNSATVLQVQNCSVLRVRDGKEPNPEGWKFVQITGGLKKPKNVSRALLGHFKKGGVDPSLKICEFRVSPHCAPPVGTAMSVLHFVPGQYVDVQGVS